MLVEVSLSILIVLGLVSYTSPAGIPLILVLFIVVALRPSRLTDDSSPLNVLVVAASSRTLAFGLDVPPRTSAFVRAAELNLIRQ